MAESRQRSAGNAFLGESALRLVNVSRKYGRRTVFNNLDLSIFAGTTALLGPNGAGKTTLLNILSLTIPPDSGTVEWCGTPIQSERAARQIRGKIAFLPQHFSFPRSYTASDTIAYTAWLHGLSDYEVELPLKKVGLTQEAKTKVSSMSGGMHQRLGIATCLVGNPELYIFDEPTVGLDPSQRIAFRNIIRELDAPIILSTHLVEDVVALADRVIVLHEGKIVFDGSVTDLENIGGKQGDNPAERGYTSLTGGTE